MTQTAHSRSSTAAPMFSVASVPLGSWRRYFFWPFQRCFPQQRFDHYEPNGDYDRVCARLQHAFGAGGHAELWSCGLYGCWRFHVRAYHELRRGERSPCSVAIIAHIWRSIWPWLGLNCRELFDTQGGDSFCHDLAWRWRIDRCLFHYHRGIFWRGRGDQWGSAPT